MILWFLVMITSLIGLVFSMLTYITYYNIIIGSIEDRVILNIFLYFIPPAIMMISLIGNIILLIWFCTLWRRQITRRRDVLKEIGLFITLFLITMLVFLMGFFPIFSSRWFTALQQTVIATFISFFPLLVFGYLCYSFRSRTRHVRFANRADIETAGPGLQTAPPSTRVSLPTDTAEHAPNFLSPSTAEPSEVTPLIT